MVLRRRHLGVVVAAALLAPSSAPASSTQESLLQDDDQLMYNGPQVADRTLDELKALGVDRVRVSVHWRNVAPGRRGALTDPTDPSQYDRAEFDGIDHLLRAAAKRDIRVLLTVSGPAPDWAVPEVDGLPQGPTFRPNPAEFGAFVEMLGRRWSGTYRDENQGRDVLPRISAWSLWNEPNWHGHLMPQWKRYGRTTYRPFAPRWYRRLYRAGTAGLERSGHGGDAILIGETAPAGSTGNSVRSPLRPVTFLRELFCLHSNGRAMTGASARRRGCDFDRRGPLKATAFAHHPYPLMSGPATPSKDPLWISLADSKRLTSILDAATAAGRLEGTLPIWYTEFGWQTAPPDPFRGVSLADQAAWIGQAERMTYEDPRVAVHGQFLLRDDEPRPGYPTTDRRHWLTWQSGLQFSDGTRKPAYDAYRLPFSAPSKVAAGLPLEVWGLVRGAPAGGSTRVSIQRRSGPDAGWETLGDVPVTHSHGYFTALISSPRAGEYRAVWAPPAGGSQPGILGRRATGATEPVASAPVRVSVG